MVAKLLPNANPISMREEIGRWKEVDEVCLGC